MLNESLGIDLYAQLETFFQGGMLKLYQQHKPL